MTALIIVMLILLGIIAIIDFKFRSIPSILVTGTLLVAFIVQYDLIGVNTIVQGLTASLFGLFLYEADFIGGIADIKVMATIGSLLVSFQQVAIFLILITLLGIIYKVGYKVITKGNVEIPFIPLLYVVFVGMVIGGVI